MLPRARRTPARGVGLLLGSLAALGLTVGLAIAQTQSPGSVSAPAHTQVANLSDQAAWRLAQEVLPGDGPVAPIAAAARRTRPTSGAKAPEPAARFMDDFTALVPSGEKGKGGRLLLGTRPLRGKDANGRLAPIDLRLRARGRGFLAPVNAGTDVLLSRSLGRASRLADIGLTVRPVTPRRRALTASKADTAFFANAARSTDVSVSAEAGGLQAMWVLRGKGSPERLRLKLGSRRAPRIEATREPGRFVVRAANRRRLAVVRPPVAWDRSGRPVRVEARADGSTLTYRLRHRGRGLRYPLVVDPVIETYQWASSTDTGGWEKSPATLATGHTAAATGGSLFLDYAGGPRTTPGTASWLFRAPGTAMITRFAPAAGSVRATGGSTSTPGKTCVKHGLMTSASVVQAGGVDLCATSTSTTAVTATLPATTYTTPAVVAARGNVAFLTHAPQAYTVTGRASIPSATIELADTDVPAVGTRTLNYTPTAWQPDAKAITAVAPVTDTGLGVRSAWLDDPNAATTRLDTKTSTCTGTHLARCGSFSPTLQYSTSALPEGVQRVYVGSSDIVDNISAATYDTIKVDRTKPAVDVSFADSWKIPVLRDTPLPMTFNATDGTPNAAADLDKRAGVKSIRIEVDGIAQGTDATQTCDNGCALSRAFTFNPASYAHGNHRVKATVTDQAGNVQTLEQVVAVDKQGPKIALSGSLVDAASAVLTRESYDLKIATTDGVAYDTPESGARRVTVGYTDANGYTELDAVEKECDTDSCPLAHAYTLLTRKHVQGTLYVRAWDVFGNFSEKSLALNPGQSATEVSGMSGLEERMSYDVVETGGDGRAYVNATTGNLVWNLLPLVNAGRGLSTFANVTYNSQTRKAQTGFVPYDEAGEGVSVGLSGLTRVNEPLDVSTADTAGVVTLVDPDGTQHQFRKNASGKWFDPPAGLQLHLRRYSSTDQRKAWAATRPDGITHFFDARGYQTLILDRNQNVLRFEYELVSLKTGVTCPTWQPGVTFSATDCRQRLVGVTDSAGVLNGARNRRVTLGYDGPKGRIATITDQGGRILRFTYAEGRLSTLTQADATDDERAYKFAYGASGMEAIQDPRGEETTVTYDTGFLTRLGGKPGPDELSDRRVVRLRQRDNGVRRYEYADAWGKSDARWETYMYDTRDKRTVYKMDARGRALHIMDGNDVSTRLRWDTDDNVIRMAEAADSADEAVTSYGYDDNGLLRWNQDGENNRTELEYRVGEGTLKADAGEVKTGFVADLTRLTTPRGAATGDPNDYQERYELDARGNQTARTDGEWNRAETEFDQYGQVITETDEVGNRTRYESYHPSGEPQVVIDAKQGRSEYQYDATGNLLASTDARAMPFGGLRDAQHRFQSRLEYDALDRLVSETLPKDSRAGQFIRRGYDYDDNGNELRSVDGTGAATTRVFDEMDRPTRESAPEVRHAGETEAAAEVTRTEYDGEGNATRKQSPRGEEDPGSDRDFSTEYEYDGVGRKLVERRQSSRDAADPLVTSMDYDDRGNLVGVADAKTNARYPGSPVGNAERNDRRRWRYDYDHADRKIGQSEDPGSKDLYTGYGYDRNDNLVWQAEPRYYVEWNWQAYATHYRYDARDLMVEVTQPGEERTTRYERREDGKVSTIVSPRGTTDGAPEDAYRTKLTYDPLGAVVERTLPKTPGGYDPQGPDKWVFQRDAVGNPTRITDARGKAYENTYLDTGDVKTTTRPSAWNVDPQSGKAGERGPEEIGNRGEEGDVPGGQDQGDFGEVEGEQMPGLLPKAGKTELRYDDELRVSSIAELDPSAAGATTTLTRDAAGRLTGLRRPIDQAAGRFTTEGMAYDRNGNLAESTDGEGNVTRMTYDGFDRLTERATPSSSDGAPEVTKSTYDQNGNVVAEQSPRGPQVTSYRCYDAVDRVTHEIDPEGQTKAFGYDAAGNRTVEVSPKGTGRETSPSDCSDDLDPSTYDALTSKSRAAYKTVRTYDGNNEVTELLEGTDAEKVTRYGYDLDGNQTSVDAPGAQSGDATSTMARRKTTSVFDARDLPWKSTTGESDQKRTTVTEFDGNGNLRREVNPRGVTAGGDAREVDAAPQQTSIASRPDRENDALRKATVEATVSEYSDDNLLTVRHMPHNGTDGDKRYRQAFGLDARGRVDHVDAAHEWTKEPRLCTDHDVDPACISRTSVERFDTGWIKTQTGGSGTDGTAAAGAGAVGGERQTYEYDLRGLQTMWRSASAAGTASRTTRRSYWPSGAMRQRRAESHGTAGEAGAEPAVTGARVYDYRYSSNGQLTAMLDRGTKTGDSDGDDDRGYRMAYDKADRQVATDEDPYNGQPGRDTMMAYDLDGNVTRRQVDGALGQSLANGELPSGASYSGGADSTFDYDEYDRERQTKVVRTGTDPQTFDTTYWPSDDRRTRKESTGTTPVQRVLEEQFYANDGREWLMRRKSGPSAATTEKTQDYRYDENGNRKQDEIGTHVFNARDQLVKWTRPERGAGSRGSVDYELNGGGDVLKSTDSADSSTTTNTMVAGRLMQSKTTKGTDTKTTAYKYDGTGANVSEVSEASNGTAAKPTKRFTYDAFDRVASQESAGSTAGTWDKTAYSYDGFDRRDSMTETFTGKSPKTANLSYVGTSGALSQRGALTGSPNGTVSSFDYDSGLDSLGTSRKTDTGVTSYQSFAKDANGSIEGLAGSGGTYASKYSYDPYGNDDRASGQTPNPEAEDQPFRFQGFYYDSGVKTYDMRARQYLPQAGRFLTQDRFESSAGDFNLVSDPLLQSRYAFAGGNPISNVEFDGHFGLSDVTDAVGDATKFVVGDDPVEIGITALSVAAAIPSGGTSLAAGTAAKTALKAGGKAAAKKVVKEVGEEGAEQGAKQGAKGLAEKGGKEAADKVPAAAKKRAGYRKETPGRALDNAPRGADGGPVCRGCGKPIGRGKVRQGGRDVKDHDIHHNPSIKERKSQYPSDVTRKEVIDDQQKGVEAACRPCNRSGRIDKENTAHRDTDGPPAAAKRPGQPSGGGSKGGRRSPSKSRSGSSSPSGSKGGPNGDGTL